MVFVVDVVADIQMVPVSNCSAHVETPAHHTQHTHLDREERGDAPGPQVPLRRLADVEIVNAGVNYAGSLPRPAARGRKNTTGGREGGQKRGRKKRKPIKD